MIVAIVVIWLLAVCFIVRLCQVAKCADEAAERTQPQVFVTRTTPVLRLSDYGAHGLGRRVEPGPMHWVELPADPDKWLEAVAR